LKSRRLPGVAGHWPHSSTRTFFLAAAISTAAALTFGAMMTSTNWRSTMVFIVSASSSPLKAMMPPKADSGSVW
jgi:hypothetical protein